MNKRDVLKQLKICAMPDRADHDQGYLGTQYRLLGCSIPDVRRVTKQHFAKSQKPHKEMRQEMDTLWKTSDIHELMNLPLFYFAARKGKNDLADWRLLKNWTKKIDNWAHSDYLSDILSDLLERFPDKIYPTIEQWNKSKNPWLRRQSLTILLYYARQRKNPLPIKKILPLIEARLSDPDPFVQKAVGWQLRECYNLWPEKTEQFVTNHATQLSATAFSYATEKWPAAEKAVLKTKRAASRKK